MDKTKSNEEEQDKTSNRKWAALLARIFEVDPLLCTKCGSKMKIVSFIEGVEASHILQHMGLPTRPPQLVPAVIPEWKPDKPGYPSKISAQEALEPEVQFFNDPHADFIDEMYQEIEENTPSMPNIPPSARDPPEFTYYTDYEGEVSYHNNNNTPNETPQDFIE